MTAVAAMALVPLVSGVAVAQDVTLTANPQTVRGGEKVTLTGSGWVYVDGNCDVVWDGTETSSECTIGDDGVLSGWFEVPESAPGAHDVLVCTPECAAAELSLAVQLVVTADLVPVPNLLGSSYEDAVSTLTSSGLRLDPAVEVPAAGGLVVGQEPIAGMDVERDTEVTLVFEVSTTTSPLVDVPDLSGLTHPDASAAVTERGLYLFTVGDIRSLVFSQDPTPGSEVPVGSVVTVTMEATDPDVTLVVTPEAARVGDTVTLHGDGWIRVGGSCEVEWAGAPSPATCTVGDDGVLAGFLAIPDTAPGLYLVTVCAPGCFEPALSLVAEAEVLPDYVVMPDLLGSTHDEVVAVLASSGLVLGSGPEPPTDGALVVAQDPAAGDLVAPGSVVTVVFEVPAVWDTVPDLTGLTFADAAAATEERGFRLATIGDTAGRVVSQDPAAGALAPPGSTVVVNFEQTAPLVVVPDLLGLDVDQAAQRLADAGFVLGAVSGGDGRVQSQDPSAGSQAVAGSSVDLRLAVPGPDSSTLPWWPLAVSALLLAAAGIGVLGRRGHPRRWVRHHVRVVPAAATSAYDVTTARRDPVVEVKLHHPDPTTTLEEVRP